MQGQTLAQRSTAQRPPAQPEGEEEYCELLGSPFLDSPQPNEGPKRPFASGQPQTFYINAACKKQWRQSPGGLSAKARVYWGFLRPYAATKNFGRGYVGEELDSNIVSQDSRNFAADLDSRDRNQAASSSA
jgi:hypothetical protein